jgi:hypothetical protein
MAKRIFINNINSYIAQAIFNELRNDINDDGEKNEDSNLIFGTYIDKDSSDRPEGINKMLKVIIFHNEFSKTVISYRDPNLD